MLALLLTLALFVFLGLLGKAVMEAVQFRFSALRSWLLAPSVGLAVVVLMVLNLNQAGLPIETFAVWLTSGLALFTVVIFRWRRPIFPWKALRVFLGIAVVSALYTCWPMFLYGFRWVGYMNADLATYALGATRAMHYGFYRVPTLAELTGTDYSQYWWFHLGPGLFRCGADISLAWVASVTHLQPLRVSMSLLGALNLAQLFAAAALVLKDSSKRRVAMLAAAFLAVSPFFLLGVMAQVLPQVGGITLFLGLCTVLLRPLRLKENWRASLADAVLLVVFAAAACVFYPETTPFTVLAALAYHGYQMVRRKEPVSGFLVFMLPTAALFLVVARQGIITALGTVLQSLKAGENVSISRTLFSDFDTMLDPSLFASLFGMQTYYGQHADPLISITILVGIVLLASAMFVCVRSCLRSEPFAFVLLVMFALGAQLFFSRASFGLFKLAMFIQPVLVVALAILAIRLAKKASGLIPVCYIAATAITAFSYVGRSTELIASTSVMLPHIETAEIRWFHPPHNEGILVDTPNKAGNYVFGASAAGTYAQWATVDSFKYFSRMEGSPPSLRPLPARLGLTNDYLRTAISLRDAVFSVIHVVKLLGHQVDIIEQSRLGVVYLARPAWDPWHSSNNGGEPPVRDNDNYVTFTKLADVKNYLVPMSSDLGGPHFLSALTSRWPVEPDTYRANRTFYAVGRHLLFEVLGPTANLRLRVSLSRSLLGLGRTALPLEARIQGPEAQGMGFLGSGSGDIISSPISLLQRNGRYYFALDFGDDGEYFPSPKTGLMRLFNLEIRADQRRVVGYCRDISLVADAEYSKLVRPLALDSWPKSLLDTRSVEYSGIYEDGWISDRAFVVLGQANVGDKVVIAGAVPNLDRFVKSGNDLRVILNGKQVYSGRILPGAFNIDVPIAGNVSESRLEFAFGSMVKLPSGDERPVAAQLRRIAIIKGSEVSAKKTR
jgi:hypothetical protein